MSGVQLQTAVFSALNVAGLTALLSTSYTLGAIAHGRIQQVGDSGESAFFPYVVFTFPVDVGFDDKDSSGTDATLQVDVWSRSNTTEVKAIADKVMELLHRQALAVTGHITTERIGIAYDMEQDGITRRAMLTFRILALPPVV